MAIFNTYIQQISFNGSLYSKGSVVNILTSFGIVCQEFPFQRNPKLKELASNDWYDENGLDVYIPNSPKVSHYDVNVIFLYKGTTSNIRTDLKNFTDFLQGRKKGANADTVQSARLAIYDEYVGFGRKDVVATDIDNQLFYINDASIDALAQFKVKFTIYDPVTEVTPTTSQGVVTDLSFT